MFNSYYHVDSVSRDQQIYIVWVRMGGGWGDSVYTRNHVSTYDPVHTFMHKNVLSFTAFKVLHVHPNAGAVLHQDPYLEESV